MAQRLEKPEIIYLKFRLMISFVYNVAGGVVSSKRKIMCNFVIKRSSEKRRKKKLTSYKN